MISIVVAQASNSVIGHNGALPWRLPSDMRQFRELTTGHTVIMGRRTYESLPPKFRPLPDRRNLVLSSRLERGLAGAEVFPDLASALDACERNCFVIGGGVAYRDALPIAHRVYATEIEREFPGDAFFPQLSRSEWHCVERSVRMEENELGFTFAVYERTSSLAV